MKVENKHYPLGLIVSVFAIIIPVYMGYDLWGRGADPAKYLESRQDGFIDPAFYLSKLNVDLSVIDER